MWAKYPFQSSCKADSGCFGAIGFFSFLFRMGEQLVRWNYDFLLVLGIGLAAGGLTAISYGDFLALTLPPSAEIPPTELPLTVPGHEATLRLRKKYAREIAAVVPSVIPVGFKQRDDAPHIFPIVQEAPPVQMDGTNDVWWDGTLRKWIEQPGLPVPSQFKNVKAIIVQNYFKVVSKAEKMVWVHTFVCASRSEAEALAAFWGSCAIQKEYLVTVPFETKGSDPLTSNDQLLLAIRRQMESCDLSTGPTE